MLKKAIVKKNFTGSVDGLTLKDYHPGDIMEAPLTKFNEWLSNGWIKAWEEKQVSPPENKAFAGSPEKSETTPKPKKKDNKK